MIFSDLCELCVLGESYSFLPFLKMDPRFRTLLSGENLARYEFVALLDRTQHFDWRWVRECLAAKRGERAEESRGLATETAENTEVIQEEDARHAKSSPSSVTLANARAHSSTESARVRAGIDPRFRKDDVIEDAGILGPRFRKDDVIEDAGILGPRFRKDDVIEDAGILGPRFRKDDVIEDAGILDPRFRTLLSGEKDADNTLEQRIAGNQRFSFEQDSILGRPGVGRDPG